ncbi:hypothetical protein ACU686_37905 [Yinghuangia aomiensis]
MDGAILAVPSGIGAAETPILYSGAADAFEEHADTLRVLGGAAAFLGADHGLASLHDVAVLSLMWGTLNGFLQGCGGAPCGGCGRGVVRTARRAVREHRRRVARRLARSRSTAVSTRATMRRWTRILRPWST